MKCLRLYISTLITGVTLLLVGCDNSKNKPGSGGCEYVNLMEEYRINKIDIIKDSMYSIQFINTKSPELLRELNTNQVKANIPEFNDNMMRDTSQIYIITIDVITSGSCTPEIIRGIELKK